jgi:hypothetical protein
MKAPLEVRHGAITGIGRQQQHVTYILPLAKRHETTAFILQNFNH